MPVGCCGYKDGEFSAVLFFESSEVWCNWQHCRLLTDRFPVRPRATPFFLKNVCFFFFYIFIFIFIFYFLFCFKISFFKSFKNLMLFCLI